MTAVPAHPVRVPEELLGKILAYTGPEDERRMMEMRRRFNGLIGKQNEKPNNDRPSGNTDDDVKKNSPTSTPGTIAATKSTVSFDPNEFVPPDLTANFGSGSIGPADILAESPDSRDARELSALVVSDGGAEKKRARKRPVVTPDDYSANIRIREFKSDGTYVRSWVRGKMIGRGGFAKVYCCQTLKGAGRDDRKSYALKVVSKADRSRRSMKMVRLSVLAE